MAQCDIFGYFWHCVLYLVIYGTVSMPYTAPGLGVRDWSPEGLYDKSVSLIPNTDEILKLVKKKMN